MDSSSESNPYSAPSASTERNGNVVDFAEIIRRWEHLRLIYNGILVALVFVVTLVGFPQHLIEPYFWVAMILAGGFANVCFFTAPAIEGYGTYFGLWNQTLTWAMFFAGLGLTAILAVGVVASFT